MCNHPLLLNCYFVYPPWSFSDRHIVTMSSKISDGKIKFWEVGGNSLPGLRLWPYKQALFKMINFLNRKKHLLILMVRITHKGRGKIKCDLQKSIHSSSDYYTRCAYSALDAYSLRYLLWTSERAQITMGIISFIPFQTTSTTA